MFLTRGYLQHHDTWQLWLGGAQGMLPIQALQKISCTAEAISTAGHTCGTSGGRGALQQQHLFSVYVHVGAKENFAGISCPLMLLTLSLLFCKECPRCTFYWVADDCCTSKVNV